MEDNNDVNNSKDATNQENSFESSWSSENGEQDSEETVAEQIKKQLSAGKHEPKDLEAVFEVPVQISAVLGRATMPVHQLLKLGRGAVVELDRRIGEAIDIYVNNLLVARGEVVVVEDRLGITMTEIIKTRTSH
jgi:flagellar motor switch protein FliN/FliY